MSDDSSVDATDEKTRTGKKPLLIGLVLALVLGSGGFYLSFSGMIGGTSAAGGSKQAALHDSHSASAHSAVAFVPIQPILVSLPGGDAPRHLRFRAELETTPGQQHAVEEIMPRILDVLNSYLRAVSTEDLERPTALIRLRAQMLRRVQLVAGDCEIRDLLVTEFVLN